MQRHPWHVRAPRRRPEDVARQVVAAQACPGARRERQRTFSALRPSLGELNGQAFRERDVALAVARLGLADVAVGELPTKLDVWAVTEDHVAPPAQFARLS